MDASLMKRTKELEDENRRPKKMCAKERLFSKSAKKSLRGSGTAISEARDGEESVD
jgi:putative transposase